MWWYPINNDMGFPIFINHVGVFWWYRLKGNPIHVQCSKTHVTNHPHVSLASCN